MLVPTREYVSPASSDVTVTPSLPAPTTRDDEANAIPSSFAFVGVISVAVAPPSSVRMTWPLVNVVITQSVALAQSIARSVSFEAPNRSRFVQVAPPSVVARNVLAEPMANPSVLKVSV